MTEAQIENFVLQFTERTLPKLEWTHRAHIIVAFWHNWHFDFHDALNMVRKKIIAYNEAVGTINSDSSGYHESLTNFWMILTRNYISDNSFKSVADAYATFLKTKYSAKDIPFEYYTKEKLFSVKARKEWHNGDINKIELLE